MTKYKPYIIAAVGLIVAIIFAARACKLDDKYSRLEGRYQEALRIAKIDSEILNATIAEKEKVIVQKDSAIAESTAKIGGLTNGIGKKNQELEALDAKLQVARSDQERVPILMAQVKVWAEKFSLAEQTIAEKNKQIEAWEVKFNSQVEISQAWKQKYENEVRLHQISRSEISALKTRLISTRLVGTVKSGLIVAAVGYLGYSALKGK